MVDQVETIIIPDPFEPLGFVRSVLQVYHREIAQHVSSIDELSKAMDVCLKHELPAQDVMRALKISVIASFDPIKNLREHLANMHTLHTTYVRNMGEYQSDFIERFSHLRCSKAYFQEKSADLSSGVEQVDQAILAFTDSLKYAYHFHSIHQAMCECRVRGERVSFWRRRKISTLLQKALDELLERHLHVRLMCAQLENFLELMSSQHIIHRDNLASRIDALTE